MTMPKYGINSATPEDWNRVRKEHPAIEKSISLDNLALTESDASHAAVHSPPHYAFGNIECIEAIKESMTLEAFRGYLKGNCMKYLWRYEHKGKSYEDLKKAEWYIKRLKSEVFSK